MRTRLPSLGLSIELPPGWIPVTVERTHALCAPAQTAERFGGSEHWPIGLALQTVHRPGEVRAWAEGVMARRVPQGEPEWGQTEVAGLPVIVADWTDGVADVLTAFLTRGDIGLEVVCWSSAFGSAPTNPVEQRALFQGILLSIRWLDGA